MYQQYFEEVTKKLTLDDLSILGILSDKNANASFKAIKNKNLQEMSDLSEAKFRKTIYRLVASNFVKPVTGNKEHFLFITEYGLLALHKSLEKEVLE